jgi:hypothetical protein
LQSKRFVRKRGAEGRKKKKLRKREEKIERERKVMMKKM